MSSDTKINEETAENKQPSKCFKLLVKIVAAVFIGTCIFVFVIALLRLILPNLFYLTPLKGRDIIIHYFTSALMLIGCVIGSINSLVVLYRKGEKNYGRPLSVWLLIHSLFLNILILYFFNTFILIKSDGPVQIYDASINCILYFINGYLHCEVILRQ